MSLLKRAGFAVLWGVLFGWILGIIDCFRVGFVFYPGGFLDPYLIDCISIFSLNIVKMIFFAVMGSLFFVLFLYLASSRRHQDYTRDLPLCGSLLALLYALCVLFLYRYPVGILSLYMVLYVLLILAGAVLLWAILHMLFRSFFPGKKITAYGAAGFFSISLAIMFLLQIKYTGILKSQDFEKTGDTGPFPNIMLIVLDTVRSDRLSCYGYAQPVTPVMDRIAGQGVLFKNCISDSIWTLPSHASIFTGLYAAGHKVSFINFHLAEELHTLSEILQGRGYQTAGFISNPALSYTNNFTQGYDFCKTYNNYEITKTELGLLGHILWRKTGLARLCGRTSFPPHTLFQRAEDILQDVDNWFRIEYRKEKPFFIFLNFMEAHFPYQPPQPFRSQFSGMEDDSHFITRTKTSRNYFRGKYRVSDQDILDMDGLYSAAIAHLDDCLGQLFEGLEKKNLFDDLFLIITSDHGEYFGEHPQFYHRLFHNFGIYNELLRLPLIIRYPPADLGQGRVIDALVQNVDLMPTILQVAGMDIPELPYPIQGRNLFSVAEEGGRKHAFSSVISPPVGYILNKNQVRNVLRMYPDVRLKDWFKSYLALQNGEYKYVRDSLGNRQLFHLPTDPLESRDVLADHSGIAEGMSGLLAKWEAQSKDEAPDNLTLEVNPETIKRLERLGYIQ